MESIMLDDRTYGRRPLRGFDGAAFVASPGERPGALAASVIADLTTTRQKLAYPSGAKWVALSYRLLPGATAVTNQYAKVVINAVSDADADGKLATAGGYLVLCQGDDLLLAAPDSEPITRIDVITAQVVGSEKTLLQALAGV